MAWPFRVTDPLLEILEVLLEADTSLHGWDIMKRTHRSGPTVYQVLERLRKARWVECWWEGENLTAAEQSPPAADGDGGSSQGRDNLPRRRYYRLSGEGAAKVPVLLAERGRRRNELRRPKDIPGVVIFGKHLRFHFGDAQ